jgi:protein-S-isoprenylcysteine O-methyltransferase Ste14
VGTLSDNPRVAILPPFLFGGACLVVVLLQLIWPLRLVPYPIAFWIGPTLLVVSLAIGIWGRKTMHRAGTNISPLKPSINLVNTGPYRFSRNPLYIAMTLLYLGLTFLFNSWWGVALLIPVLVVLHFGVVRREERYLERKFGEEYLAYRSQVRRYL